MIFVDTSAWFARSVSGDRFHKAAAAWMRSNVEPLITTDYVIDETLTLPRVRGHYNRALTFGQGMFEEALVHIHFLTREDVLDAWDVFRTYRDQAWSFTDATSKVVIEKLGIRRAFTFDRHFRQFGGVEVVPAM